MLNTKERVIKLMDKLREHEAAHKAATADGELLKGLLKKND